MPEFEFTTLDQVSMDTITEAFNSAFSDYFIPFRLTNEQMASKFHHEGIDPKISVGAFVGGLLVGFIYHAKGRFKGRHTFYNAGTGVVPEFRGHGLTRRMYEFIFPQLRAHGFEAGCLEVITDNAPAIKNYERLGFKRTRTVYILKGSPRGGAGDHIVDEVDAWYWKDFRSWWSWEPTWQNQPMCIDRMKEGVRCLVIKNEGTPVAYAIVNRDRNRIRQWAVHPDHRGRGLATALFDHIAEEGGEIDLGNVDLSDRATKAFLEGLGFTSPLQQFEMEVDIRDLVIND
jgi:ribosomal protein S18 acetylase RimI-like enzyme